MDELSSVASGSACDWIFDRQRAIKKSGRAHDCAFQPDIEGFAGRHCLAAGKRDAKTPELFKRVQAIDAVGDGVNMLICRDFLDRPQESSGGPVAVELPGQATTQFDVAGQNAAQVGE